MICKFWKPGRNVNSDFFASLLPELRNYIPNTYLPRLSRRHRPPRRRSHRPRSCLTMKSGTPRLTHRFHNRRSRPSRKMPRIGGRGRRGTRSAWWWSVCQEVDEMTSQTLQIKLDNHKTATTKKSSCLLDTKESESKSPWKTVTQIHTLHFKARVF